MLVYSFGDSRNPEAKRLHGKASMLVASALADSTKINYAKFGFDFSTFVIKWDIIPCKLLDRT